MGARKLTEEEKAKREEHIKAWREQVYDNAAFNEGWTEDLHYESVAVGFFTARGATRAECDALYSLCVRRGCH